MSRFSQFAPVLAAGLMAVATMGAAAHAQTAEETAKAKALIFDMEQKIYADRGTGSIQYYADHTSPHYLGWPPTSAKPIPRQALSNVNNGSIKGSKEKITTELVDFTLEGDTALIYYENHRTARGDGTPVDERFSNIHVWVKRGDKWMLVGGMARPTLPPIK
jgi:ketosteroid isomerase-like protein